MQLLDHSLQLSVTIMSSYAGDVREFHYVFQPKDHHRRAFDHSQRHPAPSLPQRCSITRLTKHAHCSGRLDTTLLLKQRLA